MCEHSPVIMASNRRKLVYQAILIGMAILLADQLSKFLVYRFIPLMDSVAYWYPYGGIGIFKNVGGIEFSINHMTNKRGSMGNVWQLSAPPCDFADGINCWAVRVSFLF